MSEYSPFKMKGFSGLKSASALKAKYKPLTEKEKAGLEKKGAEMTMEHPAHNVNERRIQCEDAGGTWNNGKCIKKKQYVKPEKVGEGKFHYKKN